MVESFMPLRQWAASCNAAPVVPSEIVGAAESCEEVDERGAGAQSAMLSEMRVWYARLNDALDAACERVLIEIAAGVLARELQLAPCDLSRLTASLRGESLGEPLRLRLHPGDAVRYGADALPILADSTLEPGDAILELREGSIDARFGIRLAAALAACTE